MWGIAVAGMTWYIATLSRQITYVTLADGRRQERRLPIMFRLLLPLAPNFARLINKTGLSRLRKSTERRITSAGYEDLISTGEFLSLRLLCPLIIGAMWIILVSTSIQPEHNQLLNTIKPHIMLFGIVWLFMYPSMWLTRVLKDRHQSIGRSLPFVLDLLTLSVEAGMDFMSALQRNVDRASIDALNEELIRVVREIQLGKTRRDSLKDLSERVNLPDLRSVVNSLIQADELGVSIGAILRIQADQMRQRRFERAEKLANEAPVKMLGPLMFFIFPAVFIILMGPIVYRLMQQGIF